MKDEQLKYSCFEPLPPNDVQWLRELKQGDAEAKYCLWVNLYTYSENIPRFRSENIVLKNEAARKVYNRLLNGSIYTFSFTGPFCGFIAKAVINQILNEIKRRPTPEFLPLGFEETHGESDPDFTRLEDQEQAEALEHCLEELERKNPLRYAVIRMFYFEKLTADEIAARLGKNGRNPIHQLLHNARRELKGCLTATEA